MNDNEIERMLLSLKPVSPGPDLMARVEQDMQLQSFFQDAGSARQPGAEVKRRASWQAPLLWAGAGAAAAACILAMVLPQGSAAPSAGIYANSGARTVTTAVGAATPVSTSRQVVEAEDRGIVYPQDAAPHREIRVQSIERRVVIDPITGAQTILEVPVVETLQVKVSVQ
jgi:hypothetical protein